MSARSKKAAIEIEGARIMSARSKKAAIEIDRGMKAYVELAVRNGADARESETAFKAGAMWAMRCLGIIMEDELKPTVTQDGESRRGS